MYKISKIIENIINFGNCIVIVDGRYAMYGTSNPGRKLCYNFSINDEENLDVSVDYVYKKFNLNVINIKDCDENNLRNFIAHFVYFSLYRPSGLKVYANAEVENKSEKVSEEICRITNDMLNFDEQEIKEWVKSSYNGIINGLLSNKSYDYKRENIKKFPEIIDKNLKMLDIYLKESEYAWKEIQTATNQEESDIATKKWNNLFKSLKK